MKVHHRIVAGLGLSLMLALSVSAQSSSASPTVAPTVPTVTTPPRPTDPSTVPPTQPPTTKVTTPVVTNPKPPTGGPPKPTSSSVPSPSGGTTPKPGGPCFTTADCPQTQLCAWSGSVGVCTDFPADNNICASNPRISCTTNADCTDVSWSYCLDDGSGKGAKICGGLGPTGKVTDCLNGGGVTGPKDSGGGTNKVIMYAGIGVGAVAVLAILFALVRWQRRRKRSRMPASMFGEIDYGMSNRHSGPRPSTGNANLGGASAAAVGGAGNGGNSGDDEYPFSGRPNAQGNGAAGNNANNYDDQYYDDGYAQNMHPMAGMAGGKVGEAGYYNQGGYDNYDPNYDQGYYNQGYDQGYNNAGGYNNNAGGGYNNAGGYNNNAGGYNDNAGGYNNNAGGFYDDAYNTQGAGYSQYDAKSGAGPTPAVSAPPPAAGQGYGQQGDYGHHGGDQYGVEPSELDFGGQNKGSHNPQYGGTGQGYGHF